MSKLKQRQQHLMKKTIAKTIDSTGSSNSSRCSSISNSSNCSSSSISSSNNNVVLVDHSSLSHSMAAMAAAAATAGATTGAVMPRYHDPHAEKKKKKQGKGGAAGVSCGAPGLVKTNIDRMQCLQNLYHIARMWLQCNSNNQSAVTEFSDRAFAVFLHYKTLSVDYFFNLLVTLQKTLPAIRYLSMFSDAYVLHQRVISHAPNCPYELEMHLFMLCLLKIVCDSIQKIVKANATPPNLCLVGDI